MLQSQDDHLSQPPLCTLQMWATCPSLIRTQFVPCCCFYLPPLPHINNVHLENSIIIHRCQTVDAVLSWMTRWVIPTITTQNDIMTSSRSSQISFFCCSQKSFTVGAMYKLWYWWNSVWEKYCILQNLNIIPSFLMNFQKTAKKKLKLDCQLWLGYTLVELPTFHQNDQHYISRLPLDKCQHISCSNPVHRCIFVFYTYYHEQLLARTWEYL